MDNILQGSLKHFSVSELLHFLIGGKKTGTLNLNQDGRSTWIYVTDGSLAYAFSNQEQFRLGTLLQRRKKISKAQRQQLDDVMLKEGEKFTQAAINQKLFKPEQLQDFLKTQVSEILADVTGWENGNFSMTDTANAPALAVPLNIDLEAVIAQGAMKNEEWQRCKEKLPDTGMVFRVMGDPETQGKITLSVDQWKVLFKVDGERTLEDLVREADEDPIEVYKVIFDLLQNGLIEELPVAERPARSAAAERPRAAAPEAARTMPMEPVQAPPAPAPEPKKHGEKPPRKLELDHAAPEPPVQHQSDQTPVPFIMAMTSPSIEIPAPPRTAAPEPPRVEVPEPPRVRIPEPPPPPPVEIPRVEARPVQEAPKPAHAPMPEQAATVMEAKISVDDMFVASLTLDTADRTSFPLYEAEYVIGRDAANAIHIPDGSVSSVHARVFKAGGGYTIEDLKSRNGTYVNGERVERKLLQENDKIRLGKVLLTYNVAAEMRPQMATMFETPRPS
ncbi:MAG TPA: DUF4388 domain-containing protein [Thermoanaerobaculia bacterium]|nr:DUF4388 domain-containing protein [Thermoanaerobaculia bacterium]